MIKRTTLLELGIVLILVTIIITIAAFKIISVCESARLSAFESNIKMVLIQLNYERLKNVEFDATLVNERTIKEYEVSNENYLSVRVYLEDNEPYVTVIGKHRWKNLKACGTMKDVTVYKGHNKVCENGLFK